MNESTTTISETQLLVLVRTAEIDRMTAATISAFDANGVPSILLKGRSFAQLLYAEGDVLRPYTDCDLLVPPAAKEQAKRLLEDQGFIRVDRDADWLEPTPKYAHTYRRADDGALVDLHWSLSGAHRDSSSIWAALQDHRESVEVAGRRVVTFDDTAAAVLVALHSAHHGRTRPQTLSDLQRAVERLDLATWRQASLLARELEAEAEFSAGLRLLPSGDELADRLGLRTEVMPEVWLRSHPSNNGARILETFMRNGLRGRARICLLVMLPPAELMRQSFPLARRSQAGLIVAYIVRPVHLAMHIPSALRGWSRASHAARRGRARG